MRKTALALVLIVSLLFFAIGGEFMVKSAHAQLPLDILIDTDGSITPSTSPIILSGNTYRFTGTIEGQIEIRGRSNIIIDGNGFTLQGPGSMGIWLNRVNNVKITNLTVQGRFEDALYLTSSCNNSIYDNNLSSNDFCGVELDSGSNNNTIFDNNITNNGFAGIGLCHFSPVQKTFLGTYFNNIYDNNISSNKHYGVFIANSSYNTIYHNDILNNSYAGIGLASSSNNQFYLNRLVNNSPNAQVGGFIPAWIAYPGIGGPGSNTWDNGSVGNFWGDYAVRYPNASQVDASGIGDSAYVIDANNSDRFPLMASFGASPTPTAPPQQEEASPVSAATVAVVSGTSVAVVGAGLVYYFKKRHLNEAGKL
jgi:parallel beta-helix repeat protein